MKRSITLWLGLVAIALMPAFAQTAAPSLPTGKVHGKAINPTGAAQHGGTVTFVGSRALAMPGAKANEAAILNVNDSGTFAGDVPAGTFTVVYRIPGQTEQQMTDKQEKVVVVAGQDTTVDFDMTRKEYVETLTPEQRKQLDDLKNKNKEVMAANEIIKNLNNDLKTCNQDIQDAGQAHKLAVDALGATAAPHDLSAKEAEIKAAKYTEIESLMTRGTGAKGDASVLWAMLGEGQKGLKKFDVAEASYKKALELEAVSKKPSGQIIGMAQAGLGEVYARTNKIEESKAAWAEAAKADPAKAGFFYKNAAVIFTQTGNPDAQAVVADAGLALDPNQADLYYLKGNALVSKATIDPQSGKMVLPAGCQEAYEKYLTLAPNGGYSAEVKAILTEAQQTHATSFGSKAPAKKK